MCANRLVEASPSDQPRHSLFATRKIGNIEITSLSDGLAERPHREGYILNATVEQTKAALRAAGLTDASVPSPFTVMAARMNDRLILIDAGTGGSPIYGPKCGLLMKSMVAAGLDPKDVKTILISHLHGDHIYGLMDNATNAQVFPDAEIIVPAAELKWWTQPEVATVDLGPTRAGLADRIQSTLAKWKNVTPIEAHQEVLPGVRAIPAYGHSPGHTAYLLTSAGEQLLFTADASGLPALFLKHPDWQSNFDQDPTVAMQTRTTIFERAVADKMVVAGTHWFLPNVGTIARDGDGYTFIPLG